MKRVAIALSVLLLAGAGCAPSPQAPEDARVGAGTETEGIVAEERATSGTVVSVNLDGIAADGPAVVTIRTAANVEEEIQVPSFGILLCAASANIADVYQLKAGDHVEVNGNTTVDGAIIPCDSPDHYLRVTKP